LPRFDSCGICSVSALTEAGLTRKPRWKLGRCGGVDRAGAGFFGLGEDATRSSGTTLADEAAIVSALGSGAGDTDESLEGLEVLLRGGRLR
jgi:hypothetical protein